MTSDAEGASLAAPRTAVALLAVIVLAVAFVWQTAQAFGLISIGAASGDNATGADTLYVAALLALISAIVVAASSLRSPESIPWWLRMLLPLAAVAFVLAYRYSFDPYYAPSERRFSDYRDAGYTVWSVVLVVLAILAAIPAKSARPESATTSLAAMTVKPAPRKGMVLTLVLLLLCIPTLFLTGAGH